MIKSKAPKGSIERKGQKIFVIGVLCDKYLNFVSFTGYSVEDLETSKEFT